MKDLGEAAYILGIKIYRDRLRRLIGLSQSTYLDKVQGVDYDEIFSLVAMLKSVQIMLAIAAFL